MISNPNNKVALVSAFFFIFLIWNGAQGEISVGVEEGDWIEYEVTTFGRVPEEFSVTWAKMEIINVSGKEIRANITTEAFNGKFSSLVMTFDLEKGQIGAWFIIPAGLNRGDTFFDETRGLVTIEGEEQLVYAGANRTTTNATTLERLKRWDKATGIFLECIDTLDNYSINATAIRTNMWSSETSLETAQALSPTSILTINILVSVTVASIFLSIYFKKRKR